MKTTVNVNLGGEVFILNDDAFEVLKTYTDEKGEYVEGRLATFFQNRLRKNGRKIVDIDDVNAAIESIEHPVQTECENTNGRKIAKGRKLYRDTVNGVIGGVSSGIAAYFGWDEAVIRILWVLLFFLGNGVVAIAYILFWMFVPEAATPKQRLEMYGKEITEENLREESNVAKEGSTGGGCLGMLGKIFVIMSAVFIVFPILALIFFVLFFSGVFGVGMMAPAVGSLSAVLIVAAA
ncbi:MAG: PspC domain-containing protein, partial [Bacteroidales bacterium]|nr:PspC domain-containing protein [Bacteroidales bacterium]